MTAAEVASYELEGLPDRTTFIESALAVLERLVPADAVAWNSVDMQTGKVELRGTIEPYNDPAWAQKMAECLDNPLVLSYLGEPAKGVPAPRRLSDVITRADLERTSTYNDVLKPLGVEHELTVLTARPSEMAGHCWGFTRTGSDYTDDEVVLALQMQPMLQALDRCYSSTQFTVADTVADRFGLSAREIQVLRRLADGHTAVAIGRLLRISPATVRKHLQHLYDKLGTHDRLQAVALARKNNVIN